MREASQAALSCSGTDCGSPSCDMMATTSYHVDTDMPVSSLPGKDPNAKGNTGSVYALLATLRHLASRSGGPGLPKRDGVDGQTL
jgi:hypothetical protein